jgi:hypothetical protein
VSDGNLAQAIVFAFNFVGTAINLGIIETTPRKMLMLSGSVAMSLVCT